MARLRQRLYIFIAAAVVVALVIVLVAGRLLLAGRSQPTSTPQSQPEATETAVPTLISPTRPALVDESVIVLSAQPIVTLDPYLMTTILPEQSVAAHVWDALIRLNDNLALEPGLAESWQLVNDFVWELKLRPGVSFHNGEPFNAASVKFSLERAQRLPGALETFADDVQLEEIEVVDDFTVRLHIAQPLANLPYQLTAVEMLPPDHYGATDAAYQPVGSGPYRFQSWDETEGVTLTANKDYWDGKPTIETLVFKPVPDAEERLAALEAGQADIVSDVPPALLDQIESSRCRAIATESNRRLFVGIRGDEDSPLADVRVRQALNYAIDVERIVEATMAGYGQRYGSYVPAPNANPSLSPWPYDPERARELLAQAGHPDGFSTTMDVPVDRYVNGAAIARAIVEDLAQIGVQVELNLVQWPELVPQLLTQESSPLFMLAVNSRGNDLEDAQNLALLFPFNPTGWYSADFEALLAEAGSTYNREKRQSLLWQAQAIAYDQAPWIFLWRLYDFYGVRQDLSWSPRPDALIFLYRPEAQ